MNYQDWLLLPETELHEIKEAPPQRGFYSKP